MIDYRRVCRPNLCLLKERNIPNVYFAIVKLSNVCDFDGIKICFSSLILTIPDPSLSKHLNAACSLSSYIRLFSGKAETLNSEKLILRLLSWSII